MSDERGASAVHEAGHLSYDVTTYARDAAWPKMPKYLREQLTELVGGQIHPAPAESTHRLRLNAAPGGDGRAPRRRGTSRESLRVIMSAVSHPPPTNEPLSRGGET